MLTLLQGYEVSEEELNVDLDTFKAEVSSNGIVDRNRMNFFTQHKDKPEERLFVFYSMERNVGVKTMRQFINILEEKNITRGIIIWSDKMTSAAKKVGISGDIVHLPSGYRCYAPTARVGGLRRSFPPRKYYAPSTCAKTRSAFS